MNEDIYKQLTEEFPENAYNVDKSRGFPLIGIRGAFVVERLNKVFGLLGSGWRYAHSPFAEHGKELVTELALQYRVSENGVPAYSWNPLVEAFEPVEKSQHVWSEPVYGVGGNSKGSGGVPTSDAQKSAISNALSKAASRLGVGIDAYKGNLALEGGDVTLKSDSGSSPGDSAKLIQQLLNTLLVQLPEEYDAWASKDGAAAAHRKTLVGKIKAAIKASELTDFVAENLQTIVGDKSADSIEKLSAAQLLLLNNVAKSISTEEVTWKQALELAGSLGEKTWAEAVAELKDAEKDDDS